MVHVYMGNNTCIIINILYDNLCQRFRNVLTLPKKNPQTLLHSYHSALSSLPRILLSTNKQKILAIYYIERQFRLFWTACSYILYECSSLIGTFYTKKWWKINHNRFKIAWSQDVLSWRLVRVISDIKEMSTLRSCMSL